MGIRAACCLLLAALPAVAGEITGRLTLDDRPAAGITVRAFPLETSAGEARREARREPRPDAIAKALTNPRGEFRIVFPAGTQEPGLVVLGAEGPGVARQTIPGHFDARDVEDAGETALGKGRTITGLVVDAGGRPVAGAEVTQASLGDPVRTGADGRFVLEGAMEAGNELVVKKPGCVPAEAKDVRSGPLARPLVLKAGVSLSGIVLAADGKSPRPGAVVRVVQKAATFAETDAEGRFTARELEPGRAVVTADGGESGWRETTGVVVPRNRDEPLTLVLAPAPERRGRVLDAASLKPVAGAVVEARSGRGRLVTRAGSDGSFALRPAPTGDWTLEAFAPRYARVTRRPPRGPGAEMPRDILLRLGATVSGRVADEQRRPVAGARVRAMAQERWDSRPAATALTNEDGTFALRRIQPVEALKLVVTHPDFEPSSVGDLGLVPGETRTGLVFSLRRGAALTGVVTSGDVPLAGARVTVSRSMEAYQAPARSVSGPSWTWPRATTGADGRFRIGGLSPGDYSLEVSAVGYATERRDPLSVVEGRGPDPLAVSLAPEAVISGFVRGRKGGGVGGRDIGAEAADRKAGGFAWSRTLPDGSFRLYGLKAGVTYNVYVEPGSPGPAWKTVVAPAEGIEIGAAGRGRIEGRVLDPDGRPVPEYALTAEADRASAMYNWAESRTEDVSSGDGSFVLEGVSAGPTQLSVVAKGFRKARVGGIEVEDGETRSGVEIRLARGASLRGRVTEARGGRPVPDVEVTAESAAGPATTDADGAFALEALAPGKVRVTARSPEHAPASETVEVGEAGGSVELKLSAGASISALVVSPGGEPLAGAEANVSASGAGYFPIPRAVSGPDGRVRFSHLAPGRYALTAGVGGRMSKPVAVALEADAARDDVRVVVGGGATLVATVLGVSPEERAHLDVYVSGAGRSYSRAKELPDGRFEARDVAPGGAVVAARLATDAGNASRSASKPVTVPEDGTLEVELSFDGGFALFVRVTQEGRPAEGVSVNAMPVIREAATPASATTDAAGTCRLAGLRAGTYRVRAFSMTASVAAPDQKIDVTGDRTLEFVLPSGRVTGRAVAAASGQPLSDVSVSIRTGSAESGFWVSHDATTDDAGRFRLEGLEEGPLTLTAQRKGYLAEKRTVTAGSDEVVLELTRGDGLDLTGRDGLAGTPLGSFYVRVFDGAGAEVAGTFVALDSKGRGEIPSLKPGTYSVVANANGYAPAAFDGVTVPGPGLAVVLTPGGSLTIDVPADRLKGGPLACTLTGPRGPLAFRGWGARGSLPLAATSTHFPNVPPGPATLACPGSAPVAFTVTEGGTARIAVK